MTSLAHVGEIVRAIMAERAPFVVGVTGAVAAGKSTFAGQLQAVIAGWDDAPVVEVVCTDGFLFNNQALEARGLSMRKGFPESYDASALGAALAAVRAGAAIFPGYSHVTYDIDPTLARRIERPDVLIVEGLGLQDPVAGIDLLIYLDAEEADLETWFCDRFVDLWRAAETDPASFYARFRAMDAEAVRKFAAEAVWRGINLPNLREHIIQARALADIVVHKGPGHEIQGVTFKEAAAT